MVLLRFSKNAEHAGNPRSWLGTKGRGPRGFTTPRRCGYVELSRYFVVPAFANGWRDENRASAAFRFESDAVFPAKDRFLGPNGKQESKQWIDTQDFEVLRNEQALPRAWVVHSARAIKPSDEESERLGRASARNEILYAGDLFVE